MKILSEGMGKMGEGERKVQASTQGISHRGERYNVGNTVSGIAVALYGDRW